MMTKPFPDMLDWGGLKVRTPGAGMGDFVEAMGGVNVYTAWAEMYQAMKLGTIDGVFTSIRATISENLWEQMTHIYEFRVLTGEHYTFVNPEALAALPAEYRQILLEELAIAEQGLWDLIIPVDIPGDEVIEFALSKGIEVVYPSQEVLQAMQDKVKPLWEQWAMDNGPMARDMLNEIYDVFGIAR